MGLGLGIGGAIFLAAIILYEDILHDADKRPFVSIAQAVGLLRDLEIWSSDKIVASFVTAYVSSDENDNEKERPATSIVLAYTLHNTTYSTYRLDPTEMNVGRRRKVFETTVVNNDQRMMESFWNPNDRKRVFIPPGVTVWYFLRLRVSPEIIEKFKAVKEHEDKLKILSEQFPSGLGMVIFDPVKHYRIDFPDPSPVVR